MGKIFGILLIVLGVWVGMELMTKGTDEAFGGIFASALAPIDNTASDPAPRDHAGRVRQGTVLKRVRETVQERVNRGSARTTGDFGNDSGDESSDEE